MENAVKALFIAAGVLIGLMTLSLGINLYSSLNGYVESVNEDLVNAEILQFNEQYLKYIDIDLTIHDVVTAANTAFENNRNSGYYVKVNLENIGLKKQNIQEDINEKSATLLGENLGKKYKCSSENVLINSETGRVWEITFREI